MPVSEEMKEYLASGSTNLAVFLKITAKDGGALKIWNGTRPKTIGADTFQPFPVTPSQLQASNGLKADNLEILAAFSGLWTAATLRSRKWLGARIEYAIYDYKNLSLGYAERRVGFLGETEVGKFAAAPELKSLANKLSEPVGFTYLQDCNVIEFGDNRCGVDVNGTTVLGHKIRINAVVAAPILNRQQFSVSFSGNIKPSGPGVTAAPDGYYERGKIKFITGANARAEQQILINTGNALTLFLPLFYTAAAGDQIELTAGCNRKIGTCRDKYNNAENNRSFFMLPGLKIFKLPD